jgi:hypothetical protein
LRILILAGALFMSSPAAASASKFPALPAYDMYGCVLSGPCFNMMVSQFTDPSIPGLYRALAGVSCASGCEAINGFSTVVYDANGDRLFFYANGNVPPRFDAPIAPPAYAEINLGWFERLDENGSVTDPPTLGRVVVTTTPEPAMILTVATGLAGIAAVRRRRRA